MTSPPIRVLTTVGVMFIPDLPPSEASVVGRHWNAVRAYLDFCDERPLEQLDGGTVAGFALETDLDRIEWHAVRGDVSFESIYDEVI
jgi:hypothetical protein